MEFKITYAYEGIKIMPNKISMKKFMNIELSMKKFINKIEREGNMQDAQHIKTVKYKQVFNMLQGKFRLKE